MDQPRKLTPPGPPAPFNPAAESIGEWGARIARRNRWRLLAANPWLWLWMLLAVASELWRAHVDPRIALGLGVGALLLFWSVTRLRHRSETPTTVADYCLGAPRPQLDQDFALAGVSSVEIAEALAEEPLRLHLSGARLFAAAAAAYVAALLLRIGFATPIGTAVAIAALVATAALLAESLRWGLACLGRMRVEWWIDRRFGGGDDPIEPPSSRTSDKAGAISVLVGGLWVVVYAARAIAESRTPHPHLRPDIAVVAGSLILWIPMLPWCLWWRFVGSGRALPEMPEEADDELSPW